VFAQPSCVCDACLTGTCSDANTRDLLYLP
jgi:hypothetical protein